MDNQTNKDQEPRLVAALKIMEAAVTAMMVEPATAEEAVVAEVMPAVAAEAAVAAAAVEAAVDVVAEICYQFKYQLAST